MAIGQEEHYAQQAEKIATLTTAVTTMKAALLEIDKRIDELLDSEAVGVDDELGTALEMISDLILLTGIYNQKPADPMTAEQILKREA